MDFITVVDQVITLLRQRGRVTYRTLQLQFMLDDEQLAALKNELLYSQPHVRDDVGRGLIWTGETASEPMSAWPVVSAATEQGLRAVTSPASPDAERRQLTVLFCDLVDSTRLSTQLDPEDYREVVRAYQHVCAEVIQQFEGHIAQYLGDGLLIYFGYPQAHEDDARRAVQAALGIVAALRTLGARLASASNVRLAVRIGIHTGLVVVGEMGDMGTKEQLALGDTPNIAARLQGLAAPDTVVISEATAHLSQGYFVWQTLGAQTLKGIAQPLVVYEVLRTSAAQTRLDAVPAYSLTPLIGRDEEVALMQRRWEQVKAGAGQAVLLSGEAGIGKSRMVQVLKEHLAPEPHILMEWRSSPYHQQSALYPVIDHLQHLLQWRPDEPPSERLCRLEAILTAAGLELTEGMPLLAALLSLPPPLSYPPLSLTPQRQRQRTLAFLLTWLHAETRRQPLLLVVEDLHWVDPSTLELLSLLLEQSDQMRLYLVLTTRPELPLTWPLVPHLTTLVLRRFSPAFVERLATHVAGEKRLPRAVLQEVVQRTDGVPLFVEELTKMVVESGLLLEQDHHYDLPGPLPPRAIPTTLQDSLMARLDRLGSVKMVAQLGAMIGRTFAYDLLQTIGPFDETTLQQSLQQLVEAELLYQRGVPPQALYTFKHALIQDAAYQSLLRSTRQQYHQRIAQALTTRFPEMTETQPELLAQHYTEAGLSALAIPYWQRAGQQALQRSANQEAVQHLTRGLALLATLPETPEQCQQELALQTTLGPALVATRGMAAAEVGQVYARARVLCQQMGGTPQLLPVLWGLWWFYLVRAEFATARDLGEQLLSLARTTQAPAVWLAAHRALGTTCYFQGELHAARSHLEQGIALYNPQEHRELGIVLGEDFGVACLCFTAMVLMWLGYPEQALKRGHEALDLARALAHPLSLARALVFVTHIHHLRQETSEVQRWAAQAIAHATAWEFPFWAAIATMLQGWSLTRQGHVVEGTAQVEQGLTAFRATSGEVAWTSYLALLAECSGICGRVEAGLHALDEAFGVMEKSGERFYEVELYRLKGELLLQQATAMASPHATTQEAEACFAQALAIARQRQEKLSELQVSLSLARLWQQQGRRDAASTLLRENYHWFMEGRHIPALQEAQTFL